MIRCGIWKPRIERSKLSQWKNSPILDEVKAKGQFIDQDELLQELGINKGEIQN